MPSQGLLLRIAFIIGIPIVVIALGVSGQAGLAIGVLLVAIGIVMWRFEPRR